MADVAVLFVITKITVEAAVGVVEVSYVEIREVMDVHFALMIMVKRGKSCKKWIVRSTEYTRINRHP